MQHTGAVRARTRVIHTAQEMTRHVKGKIGHVVGAMSIGPGIGGKSPAQILHQTGAGLAQSDQTAVAGEIENAVGDRERERVHRGHAIAAGAVAGIRLRDTQDTLELAVGAGSHAVVVHFEAASVGPDDRRPGGKVRMEGTAFEIGDVTELRNALRGGGNGDVAAEAVEHLIVAVVGPLKREFRGREEVAARAQNSFIHGAGAQHRESGVGCERETMRGPAP